MKHIEKIIALSLLIVAVGFNLWIYRSELTTTIDPNDNAFQYALVDRTNQIWDYATKTCPKNLLPAHCALSTLTDHWVPNWAEGYNLPYYYSHIPQIVIVGSWRFFHWISGIIGHTGNIQLFTYYHFIIYLLLCLFPVSMFLAFRVMQYSWRTSGIAALLASHISTDGLYGIDQASFLWRGWGLSSQLFALIWLPLAIAYAIQYVKTPTHSKKNLVFSILFFVFTTAGHLGIGMMAFLALPVIACSPLIFMILQNPNSVMRYWSKNPQAKVIDNETKKQLLNSIKNLFVLAIPPILILAYWIVPAYTQSTFHNISVWDPVWKFNSFGMKEITTLLVNGNLFDFNRFPTYTILVFVGLFYAVRTPRSRLSLDARNGVHTIQKNLNTSSHARLSLEEDITSFDTIGISKFTIALLFLFYLLLFFGRTTWGNMFNLIPGMKDFHQHRFLVGVHLAGLFLAPIALDWISKKISKYIHEYVAVIIIIGLTIILVYPQTISYAKYNDTLIKQANEEYTKAKPDAELLLRTLKELEQKNPGRVYTLRGIEGKNFKIASTAYYMYVSTFGFPTVLWLPETWSPNSDVEQFFVEDNASHYNLYNITYVVTPKEKKPQPFWHLVKETSSWNLYEVQTNGYIETATSPAIVYTNKTSYINLVHQWIQSDYTTKQLFPELRLTGSKEKQIDNALPHFSMLDAISYKTPDQHNHNLLREPPIYRDEFLTHNGQIDAIPMKILSQTADTDMTFSAQVEITTPCPTCVVILKQTYHPNWNITVNGRSTPSTIVFPFYTAVRLTSPGMYTVIFSYTPAPIKRILFVGGIFLVTIFFFFIKKWR